MIALDIDIINSSAPYKVTCSTDDEGFYTFITVHGVSYSIGFMEDDLILSNETYQLLIANVNHRTSPRDAKVRDTVIAIVDEFFNKNNNTLLYICETGDGKQAMRSRLFEYWFASYNKKGLFTMLSSSIIDEDGVVNYATIILRNDNPNFAQVIQEYTNSIQLLSQKPK